MTEADELYQNAGEKGCPHPDPYDPPRRRANKVRGHGTWDKDRVPIAGVVGRASGQIRLQVCHHSDRATLQPYVESKTGVEATVNTDEWSAYDRLPETGRVHNNRVSHARATRMGPRRGRGWHPRSPLQHHGRDLDRPTQLLAPFPRDQQSVFESIYRPV